MRLRLPAALMLLMLTGCSTAKPIPREAVPGLVPVKVNNRQLYAPEGYSVSVFAKGLSGPRHMAQGPDGAIYVAEKNAGRVSRIADGKTATYVSNMPVAHSVEWYKGALYIGATDGIYRHRPGGGDPEKLVELPARGGHSTRTVHFGPDDKMYVTIGSTCNVCIEEDPHRAAMWIYNADGTGGRLFAQGLRNTVDFTFHPQTGEIWGVDNGRDSLGDDRPPEELNLIQEGKHFGWPVCHGKDIVDPDFGKPNSCEGKTPPVVAMQAHSAPLGVAWWNGDLLVAFHGSWNREEKTGYKVVRIPFGPDGKPSGQPEDFLTGWLSGEGVWGRPVGLLVTKDGALLVSDDQGGVIYKVEKT